MPPHGNRIKNKDNNCLDLARHSAPPGRTPQGCGRAERPARALLATIEERGSGRRQPHNGCRSARCTGLLHGTASRHCFTALLHSPLHSPPHSPASHSPFPQHCFTNEPPTREAQRGTPERTGPMGRLMRFRRAISEAPYRTFHPSASARIAHPRHPNESPGHRRSPRADNVSRGIVRFRTDCLPDNA
ncbi:hypothetical protein LMG29739_02869 [Paraburkholderia solisilvae]|uniref:Uncharacterized protein n=1 Tax=Paraburkholderia solisilvae TaxID=624376 RepID=A0A6J5DVX9_9BURK|nr:hypothetical protein LMG29739_02869 [Paraburkholderia solisilvae]